METAFHEFGLTSPRSRSDRTIAYRCTYLQGLRDTRTDKGRRGRRRQQEGSNTTDEDEHDWTGCT